MMTPSLYWRSFIFFFCILLFTLDPHFAAPEHRWWPNHHIGNLRPAPTYCGDLSCNSGALLGNFMNNPFLNHSEERNYSDGQKLKLGWKNSDTRQFFIQSCGIIFCCFDLFSSVWKVNGSLFAVQVRINFWIFDINIHIHRISRPFVNKTWNVFQGNIHSWFETLNNPCANISLQEKHFVFLRGPCWHFAD